MARSIHTTRRHLEEQERWDVSDAEAQDRVSERLSRDLTRKRAVKAAAHHSSARPSGTTPLDIIPVRVQDEGPCVHYPASELDVRAVISRLPVGVLDGLHSVTLCLGQQEQEHRDAGWAGSLDRDPYTGRKGAEMLPGIYGPWVFGVYEDTKATISVFGYVYAADIPNRAMWEVYLRLRMLATFVHEVGHHFDQAMRTARGRWLANDEDKVELYAEHREHEWVQNIVVPYLEETYGDDLRRLQSWIQEHGGAFISAGRLAGDPRQRVRGGRINVENAFGFAAALERLATDAAAGEEPRATRLQFAREIHYAGYYDEALESIATVLHDHPEDAEAVVLAADIKVHQERFAEAKRLATQIVQVDPDDRDAWEVLADAQEGLGDWQDLLTSVDRVMALREQPDWSDLRQRARAFLELGEYDRAEMEIQALEDVGKRWTIRHAGYLRGDLVARRGRPSSPMA